MSLAAELSGSASVRQVWVFPTLSGVDSFDYRVDEAAGLVRYYFYDSTSLSFADATTAATGRSLFGKSGYLGVYTSDAEKNVYEGFGSNDIFWRFRTPRRKENGSSQLVPGKDSFFGMKRRASTVLEQQVRVGAHRGGFGPVATPTEGVRRTTQCCMTARLGTMKMIR